MDESQNPEEAYRLQLEEALEDARRKGDEGAVARLLIELGFWYADAAEYESAAEVMEQGVLHYKATKQPAMAITPLFKLAKIYLVLKRHERAFTLYSEIVDYAEQLDDKNALGLGLALKGRILIQEESLKNGLEFIFRGLQILEDFSLQGRLDVYRWIKDYKKKIPHELFDLALHQSSVSPKIKSIVKSLGAAA